MVSAMHKEKVTSNEWYSGVASRKDRQSNGPARPGRPGNQILCGGA